MENTSSTESSIIENPTEENTPIIVAEPSISTGFTDIEVFAQEIQALIKNYIVIILIAFLAMFVLLRIFDGENTILGSWVSNMIDLFVFVVLFTWIGYDFIFVYSGDEREAKLKEAWQTFKDYVNDTYSIFYTSLFIFAFYTFVYVVGIPMSSGTQSIFVGIIDKGAWILLLISVVVWILNMFFGISLFEKEKEKEPEKRKRDAVSTEKPEPEPVSTGEEVFNIGNNRYTYEDAKGICKSYGARLATYDEIEDAYNKGAEWCNYGWSEGQMAYFPTQKATWTELQKDEKHKNDCGRPGVNGGYMANPYIRFGVNCYGKKPEARPSELAKMQVRKEKIVPKTKEDVVLDMKVKFWKENADKLLSINAFNTDKWSQY